MKAHKRKSVGGSIEFMCDRGDCGKTFERRSALRKHVNLHDNNLQKCYFCPQAVAVGENHSITTHLNQHLNNFTHKCDICGKQFFRKTLLKNHFEVYHEKIVDKYKCTLCEFKTYCKQYLNDHYFRNHY